MKSAVMSVSLSRLVTCCACLQLADMEARGMTDSVEYDAVKARVGLLDEVVAKADALFDAKDNADNLFEELVASRRMVCRHLA